MTYRATCGVDDRLGIRRPEEEPLRGSATSGFRLVPASAHFPVCHCRSAALNVRTNKATRSGVHRINRYINPAMIVLAGASLILPEETRSPATVIIEGNRIVDVVPDSKTSGSTAQHHDLSGYFIAPGFIDVHVHGVEGADVLDGNDALTKIAAGLPKYGVTAFCPTTVACSVALLARTLESVR